MSRRRMDNDYPRRAGRAVHLHPHRTRHRGVPRKPHRRQLHETHTRLRVLRPEGKRHPALPLDRHTLLPPDTQRSQPRRPPALRRARSCGEHRQPRNRRPLQRHALARHHRRRRPHARILRHGNRHGPGLLRHPSGRQHCFNRRLRRRHIHRPRNHRGRTYRRHHCPLCLQLPRGTHIFGGEHARSTDHGLHGHSRRGSEQRPTKRKYNPFALSPTWL